MSKIGNKPVLIKQGSTVVQDGDKLLVKGPLGELTVNIGEGLTAEITEKEIKIKRSSEEKKLKALHGTTTKLLSNAVEGVTTGFSKSLEIVGTGFWAKMEGTDLVLALGYSHQIKFPTPEGVKIEATENTKIKVTGINKEIVGVVADKIKRFRFPDSYKGKGIRYEGEKLKLKPGKAAAKATK